jgi:hypothetical protein
MVVMGGWAFSYERGTTVGYGPEGPLLQEEAVQEPWGRGRFLMSEVPV